MEQSKFCDGCSQADDCKIIYEQLGRVSAPPVALKAAIVFIGPVIVFVATLAAFSSLLSNRLAGPYQTPLAFVLAMSVTTGSLFMVRAIVKRLHQLR